MNPALQQRPAAFGLAGADRPPSCRSGGLHRRCCCKALQAARAFWAADWRS